MSPKSFELLYTSCKYRYKCVSMGLKYKPKFTQHGMEQVLHGLKDIGTYIDDIDIFTKIWEHNLQIEGNYHLT